MIFAAGIVLIGYRGVGKTTVGRILADRTGLPFLDTDEMVEERAQCSIAEMFDRGEEPRFRRLEGEVIRDLADGRPRVVATGGGAPLAPGVRGLLPGVGTIFFLDASLGELRRRLEGGSRPSLTGAAVTEEIETVLAARLPLYRSLAEHVIETSESTVEEIADVIQQLWRSSADHDLR